ncbi:hypothetical protein [Nitratifractor sp.]
MASGWGCQHQTTHEGVADWCRLLSHPCDPGCKGCVLYGAGFFSVSDTPANKAFEPKFCSRKCVRCVDARCTGVSERSAGAPVRCVEYSLRSPMPPMIDADDVLANANFWLNVGKRKSAATTHWGNEGFQS